MKSMNTRRPTIGKHSQALFFLTDTVILLYVHTLLHKDTESGDA